MDVDVASGDVESVRVEGVEVGEVMQVMIVDAIGDRAVRHLKPRHVKCREGPVGAL